MRKIVPLLLVACAAIAAAALFFRPSQEPQPSEHPRAPLVLAAASLQESLTAAADSWAAKGHPRPVLSFAGSSALARQIESGATADLFISADEKWMDVMQEKGFIAPDTRRDLLGNSLVLVAPATGSMALDPKPGFPLAEALGTGRLALADQSVPAGRYAQEALTRLNVWDSVNSRIARAENVRSALALVARGEAPLGVVYATDARAEPRVRVAGTFPAGSHAAIIYPIAQLRSSASEDATAFRKFLLSPEGQAIFARFGFTPPTR